MTIRGRPAAFAANKGIIAKMKFNRTPAPTAPQAQPTA